MLAIKLDSEENDNKGALALAEKLSIPLETDLAQTPELLLGWCEGKLALFSKDSGPVFIDFVEGKLAHRRQFGGGKKQPLARAVGLSSKKTPTIIDATAGMGRDSFVLASLGCEVKMIERSVVVVALLEDALDRAQKDEGTFAIADRLSVVCFDACDYLTKIQAENISADVIYLDPMYPEKRKSAAVKKDMRVLQKLVGPDQDSPKLLDIALQVAKHRVVVKRPKSAETLIGPKPDTSISSPNTRYDIYSIKAI
ncbi:MAG: class I SAM-dependent methyltransferase [Gammaproteobacteria bacterium]